MLSQNTEDDFYGQLRAIAERQRCAVATGISRQQVASMGSRGVPLSISVMEKEFDTAAGQCLEAVLLAHRAEPQNASEERVTALRNLLERGIRWLGDELLAGMPDFGIPVTAQAVAAASARREAFAQAVETMVSRTTRERLPHVRPAIMSTQMTNTTSIVFGNNATVGSLQAGSPGAVAVVSQAITTSAASTELATAIDKLTALMSAASEVPKPQRDEAIEVLEAVKVEAVKERPNKTAISGLLSGVASVVGLVKNAPDALKNVLAAWDVLKAMY
jgi:hypothetical protein